MANSNKSFFDALEKVLSGEFRRIEAMGKFKNKEYRILIYRCSENHVRVEYLEKEKTK